MARQTLADATADATRVLERAGIPAEASGRDASRLGRSVLGWDEARWLAHRGDPAPPEFAARLAPLVDRRRRREPLAYILGEREVYGRPFRVTRDVLIPRPETELLIEEALTARVRSPGSSDPGSGSLHALDLGTGSGCLAVTLACECPQAHVLGVDASVPALEIARQNAIRHGVQDRVGFRHGHLLDETEGRFDLVLSNPPYVPETDRASLDPEVGVYEPATALFAGADGLDVIRAVVPASAQALHPGGWLILEFGFGQADAVVSLIRHTPGLTLRRIREDLQDIPRVAVAERTE